MKGTMTTPTLTHETASYLVDLALSIDARQAFLAASQVLSLQGFGHQLGIVDVVETAIKNQRDDQATPRRWDGQAWWAAVTEEVERRVNALVDPYTPSTT